MFEENFLSMSIEEEQEEAIRYMDEFFEAVAIGNGDFSEEDGLISIE